MAAIIGIENLTDYQKQILYLGNSLQLRLTDDKRAYQIVHAWVEKGIVCARLANGEWYHYTEMGEWY